MLKKLRQKFIFSALLSFALVMLILIAGINLLNAQAARRSQEGVLNGILEYELTQKDRPKPRPIDEMPWAGGPGNEFTSRFFVVRCDLTGAIRTFGDEYISSVDAETAGAYAAQALASGHDAGRCGNYRFRKAEKDGEYVLVFLNIQSDIRQQQKLLLASALIGAASFVCVSLLVLLLSKPAMKPYMKNIERQKQFIAEDADYVDRDQRGYCRHGVQERCMDREYPGSVREANKAGQRPCHAFPAGRRNAISLADALFPERGGLGNSRELPGQSKGGGKRLPDRD